MKLTLFALRAEMQKGFWLLWSYRYNTLAEIVGMGAVFVGISFMLGRGEFEPPDVLSSLLGYLVWFFAITAISEMSFNLTEEARAGTMEQMFMSPIPMRIIVLGRVAAVMITAVAEVIVLGTGLMLAMNIWLPLRWEGIPVFLITMLGLLGFGFFLGGVTLIYKQVDSLADLLQNILIFMTGALVPVSFFPGWLQTISLLIPSTQGIIVLRKVMLEGQSLFVVWNDGSLALLILNSTIYLVGGWLFFVWCERLAKQQGTLGQY